MTSSRPRSTRLSTRLLSGRYELRDELGQGASATVFLAHDRVLSRPVAVKVLRSDGVARFYAEAQVTGQLEHPSIVPVHDFGTMPDGRPFLVMRWVRGRTLRSALQADDLGPTLRRLRVMQQVVEAVAFAHDRGVTHRDLKPENVMIDEHGQTLVMDWGLVRATPMARPDGSRDALATPRHQTVEGALLGTPGYLPPEAYRGGAQPLQQDVYALGVLLWELVLGRWPWEGNNLVELAFEAGRPPLSAPDIDADLQPVLARCLDPDPSRRFTSALPLSEALRSVLEGTARKGRAAAHVAAAHALLEELIDAEAAHERALRTVRQLEDELPGWRPLEDRLPLHEARENAENQSIRVSRLFGSLVAAAERALSQDPASAEARDLLLRAWWRRYEQAEQARNASDMALYRERLIGLGGADAESRLDAPGALTLHTDPDGAEVWCQRVVKRGLVWPLQEPTLLGRTPLTAVELPQGSYQLTLRAPGKRDTPYPVLIERGEHHQVRVPIRLLTEEEIGGEGWVYVPAGWTWVGGDPEVGQAQLPRARVWVDGFVMRRHPTTIAEYGAFLKELHRRDPDEARRRLPRKSGEERGFWSLATDGSLPDPLVDNEGDVWQSDWPVVSIDWDDARAFCHWAGGSLPSERQWSRAFRGADGRRFPWGDQFDANLCWMGWSFRSGRSPQSVTDLRTDVSVFGAGHGAGLVREWTASDTFDGDPARAAIRGGGWSSTLRAVRLANRFGLEKTKRTALVGARPVRTLMTHTLNDGLFELDNPSSPSITPCTDDGGLPACAPVQQKDHYVVCYSSRYAAEDTYIGHSGSVVYLYTKPGAQRHDDWEPGQEGSWTYHFLHLPIGSAAPTKVRWAQGAEPITAEQDPDWRITDPGRGDPLEKP